MLYDIKDDSLKYWWYFDELGDRADFEFEHSPCACGAGGGKLIGNTTRHRNEYNLLQCQFCGTLRIDPYLTDASIEQYYSESYGKIKRQDIPAERLFNRQKKSAKLVWEKVSPFLRPGDKVLDFGGGAGGKVMEILAQGFDVYLKELDRKYFEYGISQGLKPYTPPQPSPDRGGSNNESPSYQEGNNLLSPSYEEGVGGGASSLKFEFIVLSRVLEHVNHPVKFLEYFRDELLVRPEGRASLEREQGEQPIEAAGAAPGASYIYLEVPLIENSRGDYLLNEIHIAHKFYFTNLSLKHICALAGFEVSYESRNLLIIKAPPLRGSQNCGEILEGGSSANVPPHRSAALSDSPSRGEFNEMLALSEKVLRELG